MSKILKPCPFCGNKGKMKTYLPGILGISGGYRVECSSCFAGSTEIFCTEEGAAKAWNRRSTGEWIDVNDKLPEIKPEYAGESKDVLMAVDIGEGHIARYAGYLAEISEGICWRTYAEGFEGPLKHGTVLYWQPLPELPIESEHEPDDNVGDCDPCK